MKNWFSRLALTLVLITGFASFAAAQPAEWTIMVFMNGKNDLEQDALANFRELASIGSTAKVNFLVEIGRPNDPQVERDWSGVLRFRVTKGQEPIPTQASMDLRDKPELSDMGSLLALNDFISWSLDNYRAKKYMLVIWNHGQGWRFQAANNPTTRVMGMLPAAVASHEMIEQLSVAAQETPQLGGYRAVSFDGDTGHFLYGKDVADAVKAASTRLNRKIDLVGFDACLMGMIENAYSLRKSTALMLASQELEPEAGWDYVAFAKTLTEKPTMSARELTKAIIKGYSNRYGDFRMTTLSVLDLEKVEIAAEKISAFADGLRGVVAAERDHIDEARTLVKSFGGSRGANTSIDLLLFLEKYSANTHSQDMKTRAARVKTAVSELIIENYASSPSARETGSKGVAIYFPPTKAVFEKDPYRQGYIKSNQDRPVEFVTNETWADFLATYLQ